VKNYVKYIWKFMEIYVWFLRPFIPLEVRIMYNHGMAKLMNIIFINLILVTLVLALILLIFFNRYIFSLAQETNIASIRNQLITLRNSVVTILFAAFFIFALAFIILRNYLSKLRSDTNNMEKILVSQKNELIVLKNLTDTLASLYNNTTEHTKRKISFLTNAAHDIKTPLSVIIGAIQLINNKYSDMLLEKDSLTKNLRIIKQNAYMILRLMNNILELIKLDYNHVKTNMRNCNIVYIVEEITQSISPYSESKGINLIFDTEVEDIVTAIDVDKIEKVILNLLSNAIKFTPSGGEVVVNVRESNNKVYISVKDTGPGIPKEKQQLIFERFKQVESELTRENEGCGIGLSIAKSYFVLYLGSLSVKSEENKGSEFIVELPIMTVNEESADKGVENSRHEKIIEAVNIEFSDIYTIA